MILEKNFIQMQYDAKEKYINVSAKNFANEGEKLVAGNAYIQGRVDAVADMESLVAQYNQMLKQKNKLEKELAFYKGKVMESELHRAFPQAKEDEGLGL